MIEISVFLLGVMTTSIPLIVWYLHNIGRKYVTECLNTKLTLEKTMDELNKLHNNALTKYASIDGRLTKIETELAAMRYGKGMK